MNVYSQNNEQEVILAYFGVHMDKDFKGTFLDIGANDGRTFSNTLALAEIGWRGALIEPSPKAFERLTMEYLNRDGYELHNIALGGYDGMATLHESGSLVDDKDIALVSSLRPSELKRWESLNMKFEKVQVQQRTWKTFLENTMFGIFDFISIDIEGMELQLLNQINFKKVACKLICIEWNSKGFQLYDTKITRQGYKLIHKTPENLIYGIY